MNTALWILAGVLSLLAFSIIVGNYLLVFRQIRARPGDRTPSMIPIVGGLLGFFALRVSGLASFPQPGLSRYAWLAPVLDPGCYLIYFLFIPILRKLRPQQDTPKP